MTAEVVALREHSSEDVVYRTGPGTSEALREALGAKSGKTTEKQYACDRGEPAALAWWVEPCGEGEYDVHVDTSFFVGADWIVPGYLAVCVVPKLDREEGSAEEGRVDTLRMLRDALADPDPDLERLSELAGLFEVHFDRPAVPLRDESEELGLFLAALYLASLTRIIKKGLKKHFYPVDEALCRKIKGRILFPATLARRSSLRLADRIECRYQEFGIDTAENQVLKRALRILSASFLRMEGKGAAGDLAAETLRILRHFEAVSDVNVRAVEASRLSKKTNPVFRDYVTALKLAEKIIRYESFGSQREVAEKTVPAHWIDMSKLFELYVLAKLRQKFRGEGIIRYQYGVRRQYPDFLCALGEKADGTEFPRYFVADAKYKPRYADGNANQVDDDRQLAGYARLKGVLDHFETRGRSREDRLQMLPCVLIYPDQSESEELSSEQLREIDGWEEYYKIGLRLPER